MTSQGRISAKSFLLLHLTLFLYSVVNIFAKYAGENLAAEAYRPALLFTALEFVSLGVYAILWQQTLKRMPLTFAFANKAVCTLWTFLFGVIFFSEKVTLGKGIGIAVVLAGVCLVVTDHE